MPDFATLRRTMVDGQLRTSDITDLRLLAAMLELPRERFVPPQKIELAYLDLDVPVNEPSRPIRRLLKPMVLGKLIQAAEVVESDHVLDIGCSTGYSSALLGRLAANVIALEEDAALAQFAKSTIASLGGTNVTVVTGPFAAGWLAAGPYDVIVIEGACETEPRGLLGQLKAGGRLVCVTRHGPVGKVMQYRALEGELNGRPICDATAPLLPSFVKPKEFVF